MFGKHANISAFKISWLDFRISRHSKDQMHEYLIHKKNGDSDTQYKKKNDLAPFDCCSSPAVALGTNNFLSQQVNFRAQKISTPPLKKMIRLFQ